MSDASFVETLFFAALERGSEAERTLYLHSACGGDGDVRRQVEKLLRAHAKLGFFLTKPAIEQFSTALEFPTFSDKSGPAGSVLDFLQPSARPDALGRIGHYEILEVLGQGGFGTVFRARDEMLHRLVAVKVLSPQLAATASARKRFLAEARSSAKIRHMNVVQVYAVEEKTLPLLVMELIPGESLQRRLIQRGRFEVAEVADIGRQIAAGLAASHQIGLIHRDIKPENILLEANSGDHAGQVQVKISDFGLARAADDVSMSQYGIVAGTPMYMAPEQAMGETLDHRADLFSLGSVLYTMCCGQTPFRGKTTFAVLRRVVEDAPRPIRDIVPETPQWLCEIISRLHAKNPEDRFATASEVADLLGCHLARMPHPEEAPTAFNAAPATERFVPAIAALPKAMPKLRECVRLRSQVGRRWAVALTALVLLGGLGVTEANGVTNFHRSIIRLISPGGTLVVEVDDPGVGVQVDGAELVITGAGAKEIRLKPGRYTVEARKDGKLVTRELVSVTNHGRQIVRVRQESATSATNALEPSTDAVAWERSVAALPAGEQVEAVVTRLKELNPRFDASSFDGAYKAKNVRFDVKIEGPHLQDISPVRAMSGLQSLYIRSQGLTTLAPLRGMKLMRLALVCPSISDLSHLRGMELTELNLTESVNIIDLSPLAGMPLRELTIAYTQVSDLTPLTGMNLTYLNCDSSKVSNLSPLQGMPLAGLVIQNTLVSDLTLLRSMPLTYLDCNNAPVSDAGLACLKDCKNLIDLRLLGTKVTAAGIDELSKALPYCKIEWDGGAIEAR